MKMRKFVVYLDRNVVGADTLEEVLEFPDDATDLQIEVACADCLETMISNELDTGWYELEE